MSIQPDSSMLERQSHALINARGAGNGFISRDMQDQLKLSPEKVSEVLESSGKLLGGGRHVVYQGDLKLGPNQSYSSETDRVSGRKVYLVTHEGFSPHVTIIYNSDRVLHDGRFEGEKNFAEHLANGHFQVTIKNIQDKEHSMYVHIEDEGEVECSVM